LFQAEEDSIKYYYDRIGFKKYNICTLNAKISKITTFLKIN